MRRLSFALLFPAFLGGCPSKSDGPPHEHELPLAASSVAAALGVDADLPPPADPVPPAGDLAADVSAFTTLDACIASHSRLDPLVGDALLSFGYDTFLRDACSQLEALKTSDAKKCDAIVASELRNHCHATFAMTKSVPDECPFPGTSSSGRLPTCVAVAAHDPRLCAAELGDGRSACEALVLRDPSKCDAMLLQERAGCRRTVDRLKSSLEPARTDLPALPPTKGTLSVKPLAGTEAPVPASVDLASVVSHGITLVPSSLETRFFFGTQTPSSMSPRAVVPEARLRVALELAVTPKQEGRVRLFGLDIPGGLRLEGSQLQGLPKIVIGALDKERGGAVRFTVDGEVGIPPQAYAFHVEVQTYVADLVKPR